MTTGYFSTLLESLPGRHNSFTAVLARKSIPGAACRQCLGLGSTRASDLSAGTWGQDPPVVLGLFGAF